MYYYVPYGYPYQSYGYMDYRQPVNDPYYPLAVDSSFMYRQPIEMKDYGPAPFVTNINQATLQNQTFRTAIWSGQHLQITVMSLNPGEDIGLENHPNLDQFLRLEQGQGIVRMGKRKDRLDFVRSVSDDSAIVIPAGTWHNLINTGTKPLKLYSIYAPPNHPRGTVHVTKADAIAAEEQHRVAQQDWSPFF